MKILIFLGLVVAFSGVTAVFYYTVFNKDKSSQKNTQPAAASVTSQPDQNSTNGLSENTPDQSSAAKLIGGDQTQPQTDQLDPSTFSKYEQYKSNTSALYADIQTGTGTELTENKAAAVIYTGWLTNGTVFDQSRPDSSGKLQPFVFTLGAHQVIAGWEQAMAGMKVGGIRLLIIPPAVGYGATATGSIPANSVLVFKVQLAAVQ